MKILFQKEFNKWQKKYIKIWLINHNKNIIEAILSNGLKQSNILNQEIVKKRYCQKIEESEIIKLYPQCNISQIISNTNQQLQDYLLQWIQNNLSVILDCQNSQVKSVVDYWLANLMYIEM